MFCNHERADFMQIMCSLSTAHVNESPRRPYTVQPISTAVLHYVMGVLVGIPMATELISA